MKRTTRRVVVDRDQHEPPARSSSQRCTELAQLPQRRPSFPDPVPPLTDHDPKENIAALLRADASTFIRQVRKESTLHRGGENG